jgi:hypothetical protein
MTTIPSLIMLAMVLSFSQIGSAAQWEPVYRCDGGAATLDVRADERQNLQLVIRDPGIIRYLNDSGAVRSQFGANEIILSGFTGSLYNDGFGPKIYPFVAPGVFYPSDFKSFLVHQRRDGGSPLANIYRENNGIKVQFGEIRVTGCSKKACSYVGDGFGNVCHCVEEHTQFMETANWFFEFCI